ncbi:MAG: hypothetical protein QM490_02790 [Candidatus Gracilibacteria bacterium]
MTNIYTPEEKIDYIFKELKKQKTIRTSKAFLKIILIFLLIYGYFTYIHGLDKEELMANFSSYIQKIVQPITENIVNDMVEKNNIDVNNISPEMIEEIIKKQNIN